jgi:hypothetical protein
VSFELDPSITNVFLLFRLLSNIANKQTNKPENMDLASTVVIASTAETTLKENKTNFKLKSIPLNEKYFCVKTLLNFCRVN